MDTFVQYMAGDVKTRNSASDYIRDWPLPKLIALHATSALCVIKNFSNGHP
jgi:hypothetical protein